MTVGYNFLVSFLGGSSFLGSSAFTSGAGGGGEGGSAGGTVSLIVFCSNSTGSTGRGTVSFIKFLSNSVCGGSTGGISVTTGASFSGSATGVIIGVGNGCAGVGVATVAVDGTVVLGTVVSTGATFATLAPCPCTITRSNDLGSTVGVGCAATCLTRSRSVTTGETTGDVSAIVFVSRTGPVGGSTSGGTTTCGAELEGDSSPVRSREILAGAGSSAVGGAIG